jgi:hypothetical protein
MSYDASTVFNKITPEKVYLGQDNPYWLADQNEAGGVQYPVVTAIDNSTTSTGTSVTLNATTWTTVVSSTASFTFVPGRTYRATIPFGGVVNSASASTSISLKVIPPGAAVASGSPSWIENGVTTTSSPANTQLGGNLTEIFTAVNETGALRLVGLTTTGTTAVVSLAINTSSEAIVIERLN